jgi:hypothetical protein
MKLETIRVFAASKLGWIKEQQKKITAQDRESPREYIERESHYVWGRRYLLRIVERESPPQVQIRHNKIILQVRRATGVERRREILDEWYRGQVRAAVQPMIAKWAALMGVRVERVFVRRMKTKWGSCSRRSASIRLNTDLAKKPPECLEYMVVHEMVHILEPRHNARFIGLMDRLMPTWRFYRLMLNRLPVRHETWDY